MLLCKALVKNAKVMRGVLTLFELASGLKVNFQKRSLHITDMKEPHLEMFAGLINCKVGDFSFSCLGLPIGANYWKREVWKPLLDHVRWKLIGWESKNFVTWRSDHSIEIDFLITSYLLPLFLNIISTLIKIQLKFLWEGGVRL